MANGKSDGSVIINTKVETSGFDKGIDNAKKKLSSFSNSLNKLGSTIKNTFSQTNTTGTGKSYAQLSSEIAKTEKQLDKLIEKQIRFVETGGNLKSRTFAGMEYDIEMARNKLEELRTELSKTSQEAPKKLNKMKIWVDKLKNAFNALNKSSNKSHRSILKMLATSLLFSTVFKAINAITSGFTEGINNISQYSEEANKSMSALKSSMTKLKNSFASAFMPIITAVTPILTSFIDLISRATSMVAAFFSALAGKRTYTKAIDVQEDYAASLNKTADSAKEAQKYLSGLDEIRTFAENNKEKNGTILPENMFIEEDISETILDYSKKVKLLIKKIKNFIKNEDWTGLGNFISDGIVGAFNFLNEKLDSFDWEGLGKDIGEFLKGIDWVKIIKAGLKLKINIWKEIASIWFGSFKAAPIETAVITAITALKFTGLGSIFGKAIARAIGGSTLVTSITGAFSSLGGIGGILLTNISTILGAGSFAEIAVTFATGLGGSILAGMLGFGLGEKISAAIWPENKKYIEMSWSEQWKAIFASFKDGSFIGAFKLIGEDIAECFTNAFEKIKEAWTNLAIEFSKWQVQSGIDIMDFIQVLPSKVPGLATGAVIPPNAPFMAVLGDQKHGTNIEAPLDTIKQAVREVVGNGDSNITIHNMLHINRRVVLDEMIEEAKLRQSTTGRNIFDLA